MRPLLLVLFLSACSLDVTRGFDEPQSAGSGSAIETQAEALTNGARLRIMAANVTSGNYQSYDPGEGIRIFQGTRPDVVLIQELNYGDNSPVAIRQLVDTAFDPTFEYYREDGAQIPNGIVSRYPIIAAGEWDDPYLANRDFAWARIDVPGSRDLWAVSVHLYSQSSTTRNAQAASIVDYVRANVPADDYLVIGGDFNTGSRAEAAFATLAQVVDVAGPYPVDQLGNANTNSTRSKPYDHVLVDGDLRPSQVPTAIGASTFAAGLVVDTRIYTPIDEIAPAKASDSGAINMQHMAVIKDFLLVEDPGSVVLTSPNGGERWEIGSTQTITWTASGTSDVLLEYTSDGNAWNVIGQVAAAHDVFDQSDGMFAIAGKPHVFLNEILANEPGSDTTREFVELVNSGTGSADLSGWTISDSVSLRYTFGSPSVLAPGRALAVVAALGLNNTGDSVTLRDATANVVDAFSYPASLASTDGVSMNRSPDGVSGAPFVPHTGLSAALSSPGARVDGSQF